MFGMLKRGFKPAAKSAAMPAAQSAPVRKVAPKGKTKRYRAFAEDSTDPKKVVGTEHYYVVDEEGDVFHQAGDQKNPQYTRKKVDLTPKVERDKRTGLVTKTTTYSTPEQHLAAKFKRKGMQLREETGDYAFGAPKRSTWAGKEYGKAVNWRSDEEVKNRSEYARELQAIRGSGEFRHYLMEGPLVENPRSWKNRGRSEPKAATDSGKYHRVRKGYDGNWYKEGEEPLAPPPKAESVGSPRQKVKLAKSRVFSRNARSANPNIGPKQQTPPVDPIVQPEQNATQEQVKAQKAKNPKKVTAKTPKDQQNKVDTSTATGNKAPGGGTTRITITNSATMDWVKSNQDDLVKEGIVVLGEDGAPYATSPENKKAVNKRAFAAKNAAKPTVEPTPEVVAETEPEAKTKVARKKKDRAKAAAGKP